ncbi:MAG: Uma2 family endonuclease [Cyanobacteria bacterium P01_A01_bin.114]
MVQTPSKPLTLEAFLQLPETKPASEYIDGQIIQKPMPQGKHSAIQGEFVSTINSVAKPKRIARAFPELRCTYPSGSHPTDVYGGRSTVPDIAVFVWTRILRDEKGEIANAFAIAPDWTIEILSPDQSQTKVTKNILHCLKHGTQMGWLIDPAERTVFIYRPKQETEVFDEPDQQLPMPLFFGELSLTVKELFDWLVA